MIRDLIEHAMDSHPWWQLKPGECGVVELSNDGTPGGVSILPVTEFINQWVDKMDCTCFPVYVLSTSTWLGVVHCDGACIYQLSQEHATNG